MILTAPLSPNPPPVAPSLSLPPCQVHARHKPVDPSIRWLDVARTMAGYTGADCMGLMQRAARMAARQGKEVIEEEDIYAAMENRVRRAGGGGGARGSWLGCGMTARSDDDDSGKATRPVTLPDSPFFCS